MKLLARNIMLLSLCMFYSCTSRTMETNTVLLYGIGTVAVSCCAIILHKPIKQTISEIIEYPHVAWYDHVIPYVPTTDFVDAAHFFRSRILFSALCNSVLSKEQQLAFIDKKLQNFKQELLDKEQKITNNILQNFDNYAVEEHTKKLNSYLATSKQISKTKHTHAPAYHDAYLDDFILTETKKFLLRYNMNPACFDIVADFNPERTAYARRPQISYIPEFVVESNPKIGFNYNHSWWGPTLSHAIIAHEVIHAFLQHSEKTYILNRLIAQKAQNFDNRSVQKNYYDFRTILEAQADAFPAIDDSYISHCMRKDRKNGWYPGRLYINHYNTLAAINELHKIKQWIQSQPDEKMRVSYPQLRETQRINIPHISAKEFYASVVRKQILAKE